MPRTATPLDPLPEGITLEMLDEYARKRENARRRADYHNHPERVERHRLTTYTNYLNRHGKYVIPADLPPLPWSDLQKMCLISMLEATMRDQGGVDIANAT